MRKNTAGRHNQHIPAFKGREATPDQVVERMVDNPKTKRGYSIKKEIIKGSPAVAPHVGRCIKHTHYPSSSSKPFTPKVVAFVRWQDCAGAIRRGWGNAQ
jgi:hypothetical protein